MNLYFAYAGPVLAGIGLNILLSIFSTACVYIFLNREKLKRNKVLYKLTRPTHNLIARIAQVNLKKARKKND